MNGTKGRRAERFELRFQPLDPGRSAWTFPCDEHGHVDLDGLSDRARNDYFFARALMGRDVALPRVCAIG